MNGFTPKNTEDDPLQYRGCWLSTVWMIAMMSLAISGHWTWFIILGIVGWYIDGQVRRLKND